MRIYLTVLILLLSIQIGYADETRNISVTTDHGNVIILSRFRRGHFQIKSSENKKEIGVDSHGVKISYFNYEYDLIDTTTIKYRVGDGFGYEFWLPILNKSDKLIIATIVDAPKKNGGRKQIAGDFEYVFSDSNKPEMIFWKFEPDSKHYDVSDSGIFKIELYNNKKLLISETFEVVK